MYLLDTNVISEQRKKDRANPGVRRFFRQVTEQGERGFISVITVGELRRGVDLIRHRGDTIQADRLETWLQRILNDYTDCLLDFTAEEAQVWGRLRVPQYEKALDKQIAATALVYDLTLVTRNVNDFQATGIKLLNPFK
jgi:predicted nucleic acid-binding protein